MISVFKNFDNPPDDLKGDNPQITQAVKEALYELYHGKCAFSEEKLSMEEMVVIDFLPLDTFGEVLKPANMRWGNLLPVSKDVAERWRTATPKLYNVEVEKNLPQFLDYTQLLKYVQLNILHPEIDTPENYFYFSKKGEIQNQSRSDINTTKAVNTIEYLSLNAERLTEKRKNIVDKISNELRDVTINDLSHSYEGLKPFLDTLLQKNNPSQEFSLLYYHFIIDFQRLLFFDIKRNPPSIFPNHRKIYETLENTIFSHKYEKKQTTEVLLNGNESIKLNPYSLTSLEIYRYHNIKHLNITNIPLNSQWIFLTGENGFGKTLILQAIVLGFLHKQNEKYLILEDSFVRDNVRVMIKLKTLDGNLFNESFSHFRMLGFNNFAAYGPNRTQLKPTEGVVSVPKKTDSIFGKSNIMQHNIEDYLTRLHGRGGLFEQQFNLIISIIQKLLPNITIEIDDSKVEKKIWYYEINEAGEKLAPIEFSALSAGTRSIVALVGDMLIELMQHQLDVNDSTELAGIVIIDEIDIHLHPKWQRELVINLTKLFPKVQFIASTHSPIPLLGAPPETVILNVEKESKAKGITVRRLDTEIDITKLTPNTILSSPIFGFGHILSEFRNKEQPIYTEDTYDEVLFEKMLQKKLQELMGGDLDKLKKLLTPEE